MKLRLGNWVYVIGAAVLLLGAAGSRFSFGVFLKPLTEDFHWSRGSISGALAVAGVITGTLRPVAGWLADRYDARRVALAGMVVGGVCLFGLSRIHQLWELYALFLLMGLGFTLASPATLTRLISGLFVGRRGLALSLAGSGSAIGETALVPVSAIVLTLSGWRSAYVALGLIVVAVIIPAGFVLLRAHRALPTPVEEDPGNVKPSLHSKGAACAWMPADGMSLRTAVRTPIFWALTAGFFT